MKPLKALYTHTHTLQFFPIGASKSPCIEWVLLWRLHEAPPIEGLHYLDNNMPLKAFSLAFSTAESGAVPMVILYMLW